MVWCHYVPKMYMKGFGINNKQTVRYDKITGKVITVPVESFCAQDDFLCFDQDDLDNLPSALRQFITPSWVTVPAHLKQINNKWVENALAYYIEGPLTAILNRVRKEKTLKSISEIDIRNLLGWMCWLFVANPNSRAVEAVNNTLKGESGYPASIEDLSKPERFKLYLDLQNQLLPYFIERKWLLQLIAPSDGPLLTNDRPVMLGGNSLKEQSHLTNNTIFFPISPELLLIGLKNSVWGYSHTPQESRKEAAISATILTCEQASRYVFGTNMQVLENLLRDLQTTNSLMG